jgi:DNA modification methylase
MRALYYGDNLEVLRSGAIPPESVDLIYLDPPFNSNASYNVLFKAPSGEASHAQIEAFEDTWHWNETAERAFDEVMRSGNTEAANMLRAVRDFLGENDMMAYLAMMAVRLIELRRVLKPTGSLYLHCDPTASHYLKILLDGVFGALNFQCEIIWRRTTARKSHTRFPHIHDTILHYARNETEVTFNPIKIPLDPEWLESAYRRDDEHGRYTLDNLTAAGTRNGRSGQPWRGFDPAKVGTGRHWRFHPDNLEKLDQDGLIHWPTSGGFPQYKQYLTEESGTFVGDLWTDTGVKLLGRSSAERLGYPTQKPVALLERIILASSNPGDIVLDPFCGCGTAVHAAQKLDRQWIGIDITHLAIGLIERRLNDAFPSIQFDVHGTPKDFAGAEDLASRDKFQFQWWAVTLINAVPYGGKKKGADSGIDGYYYCAPDGKKTEAGIVSVKGGEIVHRNAVGELRGVVERDNAPLGILITLREPTAPMVKEAASAGFFDTPFGQFPRIQVVSVATLLDGRLPKLPPQERGGGYKRAARESELTQDRLL